MRLTAALLLLSCATASYEPLSADHRQPYAVALQAAGPAVPLKSTVAFTLRAAPDGGTLLAVGDAGFDRPARPLEGTMTTERYLALFEPTRCDGGVAAPASLWSVPKEASVPAIAEVDGCSDADEHTWERSRSATLTALRPLAFALIDRGGILNRIDWPEFETFDYAHRDLLFTRDVVTDWSVFAAPPARARPLALHRVTVYEPYETCTLTWPEPNSDKHGQITYERTRPVSAGLNAVFEVAGEPSDAWVVGSTPSAVSADFCQHDLEPQLVTSESDAKRLGLNTRGVDFAHEWLAYFPPAEPLHGQQSVAAPGIMREHDVWALQFNLVKLVKANCRPAHLDEFMNPHRERDRRPEEPLLVSPEWFTRVFRVPANISAVRPEFPIVVQQELCRDRLRGGD